MSLVWLKSICLTISLLSSILEAVLLVYLGPNILYFIRSRFSNQRPVGKPPTKKPSRIWILFLVNTLITVLTSVIAGSLPKSLPVLTIPSPTETLIPTYNLILPTPIPTFALTDTPIPTATWTATLTPSLTPSLIPTSTPSLTPTITPLPPSSYGGLHFDCIPTDYWYLTPDPTPEPGFCWVLNGWGLYAEDKSLRLNIPNTGLLEKAIFMNIPSTENVNISFSSIVNSISGSDKEGFSRLAIGICDPNDYHNKDDFIYYTLYQPNQPTISIRVNGLSLDNISKYYYDYVNALQNLDFSLTASDLSVSVDGSKKILHQFVDRTSITAFCVYYSVPRGGQLDASIENIFIQDK